MVFCRLLDGCKTMPIVRNVLKLDTNKGDILFIMSNGHLVWSFILRPLNYHSNLNLPSNHISSINDMPNLLKIFKLSFNRIMKYHVPIYRQYFQF